MNLNLIWRLSELTVPLLPQPQSRENYIDVLITLNMCGDTDLAGAGCGSSARPVLRRVRSE